MINFAKKIYKKIIIFLFLISMVIFTLIIKNYFLKKKFFLNLKKKNIITIYITLKM